MQDLKERTYKFALQIIKLVQKLPQNQIARIIAEQMFKKIRSILILILILTFNFNLLPLTCLSAAEIEDIVYEPETYSNVITIHPEVPPAENTDVIIVYRVWYSSGTLASRNYWEVLPETTQTEVRHYIGNRLGDFRYFAQHRFDIVTDTETIIGDWTPDDTWTGNTSTAPGQVVLSPYIHDLKRGSYGMENEEEEQQLGMGPGWFFKYQLFDDSYVTIRIYPPCTQVSSTTYFGYPLVISSAPIRTIIHKTPRSMELIDSSWWNTDEWDCRDDSGTIVNNGIYIVSIDAYNRHYITFDPTDNAAESPGPATVTISTTTRGRRGHWWGSIPVDILRIMKLQSNTISDYANQSNAFSYRLTGAANVTIKVYQGGATFTGIDTNPNSDTYGEAIPSAGATLVKTIKYYRAAGNYEEGWNGYDDNGLPLANGIYTYSISAVNDYKRIATDEYGNDHPIWGNITIMRTLKLTEFSANQVSDYVDENIFKYTLSGTAKVTIKVYQSSVTFTGVDTNSTSATYGEPIPSAGFTPLKTLKFYRAAGSYEESWNGFDDNGTPLPNGIYTYTISAVSDYSGILTDAYGNVQPMWGNVTITRSVKLTEFSANQVSDYVDENIFKYTLSGTAKVTIKVYQSSVTFTGVDTSSTSATYGEPIPSAGFTPLKTLKFYRAAGSYEESWNGFDDNGTPLPNGIYTYTISGVSEYKGILTDASGSIQQMWGSVAIMTPAQSTISTGKSVQVESLVFDPKTASNVITIKAEESVNNITPIYKFWYSSGTLLSSNNWEPFAETTQTEARHYIGDRLGDFRYCVQVSFDGGQTWTPNWGPTWTGTNPSPADQHLSPYIHDLKRGSYTDNSEEEEQLGMGPGWFFKYQLFDDSYVTMKIYPSSTTPSYSAVHNSSYTYFGFPAAINKNPIRTIIHKTPRSQQMGDSSWWNTDEWDCRDDNGNIVDNDVYIVVIDAYDKHWVVFDPTDTDPPVSDPSDPMPRTGRRGTRWLSIPVDILRIMKLQANTITNYENQEDAFSYRLTGAANVTIKVYQGGATFTGIDTNPNSDTYGEAIPSAGAKLYKTIKYYRAAGNYEEGWNGYDENGVPLANGIYTYSISAVNDYKRIATDAYGNDHPIWGNITIMRTLKLTEFSANPIVDYIGEKTFKYTLTGAAYVTINVYQKGVTFTGVYDSSGIPAPSDGYTPLATLGFYRAAGSWEESWDGRTDDEELLPDSIYTYTISAISDYGGIATDAYGNTQPMWGNITIMREEPPANAEEETGTTATGTGNIVVGTYSPPKNKTVSAGVSSVVVSVVDKDVIVDTSKSAIALTDPLGRQIKTTPVVNGKTFGINVPPLTVTGEYKVNLQLVAKNSKHWTETYKFSVEKSNTFNDTVYACPNPAKSNSIKIAFQYSTGEKANIKIFSIAGNLIKDENVDTSPYEWNLSDVGNGLYFYKVEIGHDKSKLKTIMVAR
ncbi:MAG: T9SS type A sorting domain-containing protein [Elusimicrobiota bacterium]